MIEPVVKMVDLSCAAERAFEVFVEKTTDWWPKGRHSVSAGKGAVARGGCNSGWVYVFEELYAGACQKP